MKVYTPARVYTGDAFISSLRYMCIEYHWGAPQHGRDQSATRGKQSRRRRMRIEGKQSLFCHKLRSVCMCIYAWRAIMRFHVRADDWIEDASKRKTALACIILGVLLYYCILSYAIIIPLTINVYIHTILFKREVSIIIKEKLRTAAAIYIDSRRQPRFKYPDARLPSFSPPSTS